MPFVIDYTNFSMTEALSSAVYQDASEQQMHHSTIPSSMDLDMLQGFDMATDQHGHETPLDYFQI
jgi:hypothetical protein